MTPGCVVGSCAADTTENPHPAVKTKTLFLCLTLDSCSQHRSSHKLAASYPLVLNGLRLK